MTLEGIRVVEIGQVLSAPYAGMILAELGAEVIKIEKPGSGDDARHMGPEFRDGASMTFHDVNRGKRSVVVDLKSPKGLEQLFLLLDNADILIHNLRPGEVAKLGIDSEKMLARFPKLIYCDISAFGHQGPRRLQPGYEPLLQAYSGLVDSNGSEEGPASRIGASIVDQGTGMWVVIGVLSALRKRDMTGQGSVINVSLLETAMAWIAPRVHGYVNEGRVSKRYGTAHPGLVPYQGFETQDYPVMICVGNDRLFQKFAKALNQEHWCEDERFNSNRKRLENREMVVKAIQEVLLTAPRAHWISVLESAGVPVAAINTVAQIVAEPQVQAMGILSSVGGEEKISLVGLPISIDSVRPTSGRTAPKLGEATDFFLGNESRNPDPT